MLSEEEQKYIRENTTRFDHLFETMDFIFGEPFLYNDFIYYFDSKTVFVCVEKVGAKSTTPEEVYGLLREILKRHQEAENIIVSGHTDEKLDFSWLNWNAVVKIENKDDGLAKARLWMNDFDQNFYKLVDIRSRLKSRGYQIKLVQRDMLTAKDIKFISDSYAKREKEPAEIWFDILFAKLMGSDSTWFCDVYKNNEPVAFACCTILPNFISLNYTHHDYTQKYSMEAAYLFTVDVAVKRGVKVIDFGESTEGIFKFKTKFFVYKPRFRYAVYYVLRRLSKEREHLFWSYLNYGLERLGLPSK